MKLNITEKALSCLKEEWGFEAGESIRVYVRYAGGGGEPYALGITRAIPVGGGGIRTDAGGIVFFMEESDLWFLEERDLVIDAKGDEIQFIIEGL